MEFNQTKNRFGRFSQPKKEPIRIIPPQTYNTGTDSDEGDSVNQASNRFGNFSVNQKPYSGDSSQQTSNRKGRFYDTNKRPIWIIPSAKQATDSNNSAVNKQPIRRIPLEKQTADSDGSVSKTRDRLRWFHQTNKKWFGRFHILLPKTKNSYSDYSTKQKNNSEYSVNRTSNRFRVIPLAKRFRFRLFNSTTTTTTNWFGLFHQIIKTTRKIANRTSNQFGWVRQPNERTDSDDFTRQLQTNKKRFGRFHSTATKRTDSDDSTALNEQKHGADDLT